MVSRRESQSRKRFDVFDFADEGERVEKQSAKILARFKNPNRGRKTPSPLTKYKFLQCFARQNEINSSEPIDLDEEVADCSRIKRMQVSNGPIELESEVKEPQSGENEISKRSIDLDVKVADCCRTKQKEFSNGLIELDSEFTELQPLQSQKAWKKKKIDIPIDVDAEEVQANKTTEKLSIYKLGDVNACVTSQLCTCPAYCPVKMRQEKIFEMDTFLQYFSLSYKNERVGVISDEDRIDVISPSAFSSSPVAFRDSPEEQLSVHAFEGYEIERENVKVVISPDFLLYRGMYCTEGQLTFSKTCIKFEGSTVNGTQKKISFLWTVDDIVSVDAQWLGRVETVIMNLAALLSKNSKRAGNENEAPAIGVLKLSVCDPFWSEREKEIKSLSVRYKDLWNVISDENEENAFIGQSSRFLSEPYFSDFHEHFEEVIYPKGDPDAISISKRDVALLQPQTFINDTIVDFYIIYLKNKIQPEEQHRFHFFNCFFFRKLAGLDKGLPSACQASAAFQRVRKWTKKVDIFEKDYIFIPVNYSLHWSLIVICHPGEVANLKDDKTENLLNVPCILHMNSIRGSHRGLKKLFQSYLSEEWKERNREAADDIPSIFLHLQFVQPELPQQENSFDCGLFLLHYVELFLRQASTNFFPFKLNKHWFPPAEASLKRSHMKKLIYEILEEQSRCSTSDGSICNCPSFLLPGQSEQETGVQIGSSAKICHGHSSNSTVKQGPNSFVESPPIIRQGCKASGLESSNFYEVGICGGPLSWGNYRQNSTHGKRIDMSPIEEIEETTEEIAAADLPLDLDGQQVVGQVKTASNQKIPLHFDDSALNKLIDSLDSAVIELEDDDELLPEFEVFSQWGKFDKPEHSSTRNEGPCECIVEDSQELNEIHS